MARRAVRIEAPGINPDGKKELDGWEATPQQRFERLLRETKVFAGLLITGKEIRLIYAPQGETSGWQAFPVRALTSVPGRPILGGVKLLLDRSRFFGEPNQRLTHLLKRSREAQATVSTELSAQVLGALHELLRGIMVAEARSKGVLIADLARSQPHHLYEGLLTVLMRLVFVLYAEDRDLIPSRTEKEARELYTDSYSVRGLFVKLNEDEALNPDTMDDRVGGWGQLLALFRLIHRGHGSGFIRARGGKLFDPEAFPFIEGRRDKDDPASVLAVSDGCLLRILRGLMLLKGERLSYRALDVEAIGSVYETVMGFTVEVTKGAALAIKAGKNNKVPVFVDLDALLALKPGDRIKHIKTATTRALTGRPDTQVKAAKSMPELLAALENIADERGSPERRTVPAGTPVLQPTDERRRSGSHYTPRSLTLPIVLHALEPTFERLGPDATPEQILDLKVCDPAMGSGAFLVEACRQLGARLQQAWARWPELKPPKLPDDEDEELHAKRLVAQRCLYGVDLNPMATDLAKLSLWLATLARDHEFEFVDHALKTGDSLVGLSTSGIAAANWDDGKPGLPLFKTLVNDEIKKALKAREEIRNAPDDVFRAIQEVRHRNLEKQLDPIRAMGDATIAALFSEAKPRAREQARQKVESLFTATLQPNWDEIYKVAVGSQQGEHSVRPFHWQLEFPEVFARKNPGFDAIVGNPPFLGGAKIWPALGGSYADWLRCIHDNSHGKAVDLVVHFFRRSFGLINLTGAFGLIATNTIAQGDSRDAGLKQIGKIGGQIYRVERRLPWPGLAAVIVSVIHVSKSVRRNVQPALDGEPVVGINSFLIPHAKDFDPQPLASNKGRCFRGCDIYGLGLLFSNEKGTGFAGTSNDMQDLITRNKSNAARIFPFVGGKDVADHPQQRPHRHVISFADFTLEKAREWPDLLEIVESRVKPERDKLGGYSVAERRKEFWWQFGTDTPALYRSIAGHSHVIVTPRVAPMPVFCRIPTGAIFNEKCVVFPLAGHSPLAVLQARTHEAWLRVFTSTLKDDLNYAPTDCFFNFPFPPAFETSTTLEAAGQAYHDHRAALMIGRNEGLTKTYNRFHNPAEDSDDIVTLRELHGAMDRAVLTAYGWADLATRAVSEHLTEATEDDHKYQGRYFWPAPIRDDVLARLLALNATRAEEERLAGPTPAASDDEAEDGDGDNGSEE